MLEKIECSFKTMLEKIECSFKTMLEKIECSFKTMLDFVDGDVLICKGRLTDLKMFRS